MKLISLFLWFELCFFFSYVGDDDEMMIRSRFGLNGFDF